MTLKEVKALYAYGRKLCANAISMATCDVNLMACQKAPPAGICHTMNFIQYQKLAIAPPAGICHTNEPGNMRTRHPDVFKFLTNDSVHGPDPRHVDWVDEVID